jgi:hypothetical protein
LNAYIAETYVFIGLKRKGALYYRSAAFSGLTLLSEQEGYHDEIDFFDELIKQARTGYGIDGMITDYFCFVIIDYYLLV